MTTATTAKSNSICYETANGTHWVARETFCGRTIYCVYQVRGVASVRVATFDLGAASMASYSRAVADADARELRMHGFVSGPGKLCRKCGGPRGHADHQG